MRKIRQTFLFTLFAAGLLAFAPAALAETTHLSDRSCAHKVLSDPRVPITFGSLSGADTPLQPTVRIPQPRRR